MKTNTATQMFRGGVDEEKKIRPVGPDGVSVVAVSFDNWSVSYTEIGLRLEH